MLETKTPQDFIHESLLLIQAHPATTRTTTTYSSSSTVPGAPTALPPSKDGKPIKKRRVPTLRLKTYDPVSGAAIVFQTDKAADIGRVFAALGKVGQGMAGLTVDEKETEKKEEVPSEAATPAAGTSAAPAGKDAGGGGGKGKKKKGKR